MDEAFSASGPAPVDLGTKGVLRDTYAVYRRLFLRTMLVGGLVFGAIELYDAYVSTHGGGMLALLTLLAVTIAGTSLVQGSLVDVVRNLHEGRPEQSIRQLYERSGPRLGALVGVSLLSALGLVLGLLALVIPGVILAARWSLAVPIVMLEGASPIRALKRSNELVRGHTGKVLRVLLNVGVLVAVLGGVIRLVAGGAELLQLWVTGVLAAALTAPYLSHALTVVYYRLTEPERPLVPERPESWASVWEEQDTT
jgi:amino acid permease